MGEVEGGVNRGCKSEDRVGGPWELREKDEAGNEEVVVDSVETGAEEEEDDGARLAPAWC